VDGTVLIRIVEGAVYYILGLVALALEVWAFFDCVRHRANAFEAVGKRTKTFWLAVTGASMAIGALSVLGGGGGGLIGPFGLFGLAAVVAASIYLADVRPAVKDAGRGGSRNRDPYGPW
jgi:hypothetical protein